ncbi:hypothetical protein BIY24_02415 [Halobacteriovorax marinus]|uniref:Membrane protein n=1 Tax=Halobacteriovorax marinus (strain ATCC BAA-682 / DSM 15412 / SJ) TaxID=862908 RepID=E1X4G7_HALMS|nr:hypothetical protein [Halobacteriovorax marinus]ATH06830.1 hypothetical protein BIY24_02415 [Halobacteriovorax marinus]CBW25397.1 putative membrane protein [Halobacteriovorax marinus SJ]
MGSSLINTFIYLFIYYIAILNIALVFYARPQFLGRFSFNYGNPPIRFLFAVLLLLASIGLGVLTCILRYFNSIIIF